MYRQVDCGTWDDPWFADLHADAKLLFLYLLTNRRSTAAGAFEITTRQMAFETGLEQDRITELMPILSSPKAQQVAFRRAGRLRRTQEEVAADLKRRNRPSPHVWSALRCRVFARDDYTCRYCGVRGVKLECDHIVPASRGGSHHLSNLATACFTCNRSKRDRLVEEWRR